MAIFAAWIQSSNGCTADPLSIARSDASTRLHHRSRADPSERRIVNIGCYVGSSFGGLCHQCFPTGRQRTESAPGPTEVVALPLAGDLFERPDVALALATHTLDPIIVSRAGWRTNELLVVCRAYHYMVSVSVLVSI